MKNPYETCPQLNEHLYGDPLSSNYHGYSEAALKQKALDKKERDRYIAAVEKLKREGKHHEMSVMSDEFEDLIDKTMEEMKYENH